MLPATWAYRLSRWKNIALMTSLYRMSRRFPGLVRKGLLRQAAAHLGPGVDVATHFTPRYDPWEQRLCLVPDADLFAAIREGRASVVTDHIGTFTEKGIALKSGGEVEADIVVTATGLVMQPLGGIALTVDGRPVDLGTRLSYKGVMLSGVPNLALVFGYVNASWTLKADLICAWVCRLLNVMERKGARQVTPTNRDEGAAAPFVEHFSPGLHPAGPRGAAEAGSPTTMARPPGLPSRHPQPQVEPHRRRRAGVLATPARCDGRARAACHRGLNHSLLPRRGLSPASQLTPRHGS